MRRNSLIIASGLLGLALSGCGGSDNSSSGTPLAIKGGGRAFRSTEVPTGDLTQDQIENLPVGTLLGVVLDRNNSGRAYYRAKIEGYDALDNLVWVSLLPEVTTPSGSGDSGSQVFTLSDSFRSGDPRNSKVVCSLSYGQPDNMTNFFGTPVTVERQTGPGSGVVTPLAEAVFAGKHLPLKPLATPVLYSGIPDFLLKKTIARTAPNSILRNMQSVSGFGALNVKRDVATLDPEGHNTIMTFMARGDIVFSGVEGSVTVTDGDGWLGYGHPLQGGGEVNLATSRGSVLGMFQSPVFGTYKLANPVGPYNMSMVYDGQNGVRIANSPAQEVSITTQLVDAGGTVIHTAHHWLGYDGLTGDQAALLTACAEAPISKWYDRYADFPGSAVVSITTVIKGISTSNTVTISQRDGLFFGFDPADQTFDSLDSELATAMTAVETSGDRTATVEVSYMITSSLQPT